MNNRKLVYADELKEKLSNVQFAGMGYYKANKAIDECTAVDVVPVVHGWWIEYQVPHIMCCSECDWGTGVQSDFKYCPNCGARMDGERRCEDEG